MKGPRCRDAANYNEYFVNVGRLSFHESIAGMNHAVAHAVAHTGNASRLQGLQMIHRRTAVSVSPP